MTFFYPFAQYTDKNLDAKTDFFPFGQWADPAIESQLCYNAMFGKGNYDGPDPALEGHWELQDNAATATVVDSSGRARNLTTEDATNTSSFSVATGPKTWLPRALNFDADLSVEGAYGNVFSDATKLTLSCWANPTSYGGGAIGRMLSIGNTDAMIRVDDTGMNSEVEAFVEGTYATLASANPTGVWAFWTLRYDGATVKLYKNGVEQASTAETDALAISENMFRIGNNADNTQGFEGPIAGVSASSRAWSDAEILEAYSGPEPYNQSIPTITGTVARGATITLNAGTWNSQNNGTMTYTYRLLSYSNTNFGDRKLEKTITTTKTSWPVILRGSALVGRFLQLEVTASNAGGFDPMEAPTSALTVAVAAGSDPSHESYNALFGRGRHLHDPELKASFLLNETSGTTVADQSRSGVAMTADATINSTTGPNSYLTNAINLGANSNVLRGGTSVAGLLNSLTNYSICGWAYRATLSTNGNYVWSFGRDNINLRGFRTFMSFGGIQSRLMAGGGNVDDPTPPAGGVWISHVSIVNGVTASFYLNGAFTDSGATGVTNDSANTKFLIGAESGTGTPAHNFAGLVAHTAIFSKSLTASEVGEYDDGPEPLNLTAPAAPTGTLTVGSVLTAQVGTWDMQLNTSVSLTHTYQWYRADDTNGTNLTLIGGATASTYTLVAGDANKYITCLVGGVNAGGRDAAEDTFSAYTAQVAGGSAPTITSDQGTYTQTGYDVSFNRDVLLASDQGNYTLGGQVANLTVTKLITSDYGIYSQTGYDVSLLTQRALAVDQGNYSVAGQDASLIEINIYYVTADQGLYLMDTNAQAYFLKQYAITSDYATYSITGYTLSLVTAGKIVVDQGSYVITGQDASLAYQRALGAAYGNYSLTGQSASFLLARSLTADQGSYSQTGQVLNFLTVGTFPVDAGNYSISGQVANYLRTYVISLAQGTYSQSGQPLFLSRDLTRTYDSGNYTMTGNDITFTVLVTYFFTANHGVYLGDYNSQISFLYSKLLSAESGNYSETGYTATFFRDLQSQLESGNYIINGNHLLFVRAGIGAPYYFYLFANR